MRRVAEVLLEWFRVNQRDLPWRHTYDPYHVWISEVMLQQTQMERGVARFLSWIEKFPDVGAVAAASEQEILKSWEGLGYYARARNLHRAAQQIVGEYGGEVPSDYTELLGLPGVGPYTAAAVSSIAGNNDVVAIDANVIRVISRLFDIEGMVKDRLVRAEIETVANRLLPKGRARNFNQAMMEFGALVCRPKNPDCSGCPLSDDCMAFLHNTVHMRPQLAKGPQLVQELWLAAIIMDGGRLYLRKRPSNGLWGGLWEFPGTRILDTESKNLSGPGLEKLLVEETGIGVRLKRELCRVKHQYTNHRLTVIAWFCELAEGLPEGGQWVAPADLDNYGFPAGPRKIIETLRETGFFLSA